MNRALMQPLTKNWGKHREVAHERGPEQRDCQVELQVLEEPAHPVQPDLHHSHRSCVQTDSHACLLFVMKEDWDSVIAPLPSHQ